MEGTSGQSLSWTQEIPDYGNKLLKRLNEFRKATALYDICIHTQNGDFNAHKVVLAACGGIFRTCFVDEEKKMIDNSRELTLNCSAEGLGPIIRFAYTGILTVTTRNAVATMIAAEITKMKEVQERCADIAFKEYGWVSIFSDEKTDAVIQKLSSVLQLHSSCFESKNDAITENGHGDHELPFSCEVEKLHPEYVSTYRKLASALIKAKEIVDAASAAKQRNKQNDSIAQPTTNGSTELRPCPTPRKKEAVIENHDAIDREDVNRPRSEVEIVKCPLARPVPVKKVTRNVPTPKTKPPPPSESLPSTENKVNVEAGSTCNETTPKKSKNPNPPEVKLRIPSTSIPSNTEDETSTAQDDEFCSANDADPPTTKSEPPRPVVAKPRPSSITDPTSSSDYAEKSEQSKVPEILKNSSSDQPDAAKSTKQPKVPDPHVAEERSENISSDNSNQNTNSSDLKIIVDNAKGKDIDTCDEKSPSSIPNESEDKKSQSNKKLNGELIVENGDSASRLSLTAPRKSAPSPSPKVKPRMSVKHKKAPPPPPPNSSEKVTTNKAAAPLSSSHEKKTPNKAPPPPPNFSEKTTPGKAAAPPRPTRAPAKVPPPRPRPPAKVKSNDVESVLPANTVIEEYDDKLNPFA